MYRKSVSDFCPKHSKCTEYLQKILEKYWTCTQSIPKGWSFNPETIGKYFILAQIIRNISNFYPKHPKSFWFRVISSKIIDFVCKALEIYRIFTQTLKKYLISIQNMPKGIVCLPKTLEKYRILILDPKHSELSRSDFRIVWGKYDVLIQIVLNKPVPVESFRIF